MVRKREPSLLFLQRGHQVECSLLVVFQFQQREQKYQKEDRK